MNGAVLTTHAVSLIVWAVLWERSVTFRVLFVDPVWWAPFLAFVLGTVLNACSEGLNPDAPKRKDEIEKLKSLSDWSGKLITVLTIAVGGIWYLFAAGKMAYGVLPQLRAVVTYVGVVLFLGVLPVYWVRAGENEAARLLVLKHVKTACYLHCLCWMAALIIIISNSVWTLL